MSGNKQLRKIAFIFLFAIPAGGLTDIVPFHTFNGFRAYGQLGYDVAAITDIDGDNVCDLIIGAPGKNSGGSGNGETYVFSGFTGDIIYSFYGENDADWFGRSVASAGDVNNDGIQDIIVGAPHYSLDPLEAEPGRAYLFSGHDGGILYSFVGENGGDDFGWAVATVGDVNQDDYDDFIISANASSAGAFQGGRAYVFSGQTGDTLYVFTGTFDVGFFATSVSPAGDVNNDGFPDILIGCGREYSHRGRAYVYSGLSGEQLHLFDGENYNDWFGYDVSLAGDADEDGYDDVLIGAHYNDDHGLDAGKAYVYSGRTGEIIYEFYGENESDAFGSSVGSAGDVNGDGFVDFIIGAISNSEFASDAGKVYVYSGFSGGLISAVAGTSTTAHLGSTVSTAGDINGDGRADIIIGADASDVSSFNAGQAFVFVNVPCCEGLRGDINADGANADIVDIVYIVNWIFKSGATPACQEEADLNIDAKLNILDLTCIISFYYRNGPPPPGCASIAP